MLWKRAPSLVLQAPVSLIRCDHFLFLGCPSVVLHRFSVTEVTLVPAVVEKQGGGMGYVDAQEGALSRTAFRSAEKKYKRYTQHASSQSRSRSRRKEVPATDVSEVLDFRIIGEVLENSNAPVKGVSRVKDLYDWPVYTLDRQPGFFFIPEALSKSEQLYWTLKCLSQFPEPPNRTNHNALYGPISNLWPSCQEGKILVKKSPIQQHKSVMMTTDMDSVKPADRQQDETLVVAHTNLLTSDYTHIDSGVLSEPVSIEESCSRLDDQGSATSLSDHGGSSNIEKSWEFRERTNESEQTSSSCVLAETLMRKLRWATVGLQFDWSKRAYNESLPFQEIPSKLAELAAKLAKPAMDGGDFNAEAAIINFYGPDDMLGGHVDDMEADMNKPIVSISLGCKAIFLLGGPSREEPPVAMFLRSGDVVLMAGSARQCYHGVPRIFNEEHVSELPDFTSVPYVDTQQLKPVLKYLQHSRINVNIRQVH